MTMQQLGRVHVMALLVSIGVAMTPDTLVAQPVDPILTGPNEIRFIGNWRVRALEGDADDYWTVFVRPGGTERFNRDETELIFHILENGMWWLQLEIEGVPTSCENSPPCSPASIIAFTRVSAGVFHVTARTNDLESDVTLELERIELIGGVPPCRPIVSPTREVFVSHSGVIDAPVNVYAAAGCQWTASKEDTSWPVTLTGSTGAGDGTVRYTVGPNATGTRQTYTIKVHPVGGNSTLDQRFTILQPSIGVPQILPLLVGDRPFGTFPVGTTSPPRALAVRNDGTVVVTFTRANDCPSQGFRVLDIPSEGITLQPNGSTELRVVFTPQRPGPHSCPLSFPPDPGSTLLLEGTGAAAGGPLTSSLNATSYSAGQTMVLTGTLAAMSPPRPVDAYVVLQLPSGQLLSLQLGGGLVAGIVPIARGFTPVNLEAPLVQYTFNGGEPPGTYTWYSVLTEAGTLNFVGPLQQATFTVP